MSESYSFQDEAGRAWRVSTDLTVLGPGRCKGCGATVLWCSTPLGKKLALSASGSPHFQVCKTPTRLRREEPPPPRDPNDRGGPYDPTTGDPDGSYGDPATWDK